MYKKRKRLVYPNILNFGKISFGLHSARGLARPRLTFGGPPQCFEFCENGFQVGFMSIAPNESFKNPPNIAVVPVLLEAFASKTVVKWLQVSAPITAKQVLKF